MILFINNIDGFLGEIKKFQEYKNNLMLQQAVERNLEIIGEAMGKILKLNPNIQITNSKRIVDTRNKLIHGNDEIEPENIWNILINHLPLLKSEIEKL